MKFPAVLSAMALSTTLCFQASAQNADISVIVPDTAGYQNVNIFVSGGQGAKPAALQRIGNVYQGEIAATPSHFYCISMNDRDRQLSFPVYSDTDKCEIVLTSDKMSTQRKADDNVNKAIAEYGTFSANLARKYGDEFITMPDDEIKKGILSLITVADSLADVYNLQGEQADFMHAWGTTSAYSVFSTIEFLTNRQNRRLPFSAATLLPAPESALDNQLSLWFYDTPNIVTRSLEGRTAPERIASLFEKYSTQGIRDKVKMNIARQFISSHNYAEHFDEGREQLQDMITRYDLPESLLKEYDGKRATIAGTPFPDGIVLRDAYGNEVPFSTFAGKYVYVDLWASWCGPCCREVPYLQELEKDLGREDVTFLSISVDSDKDAWLNRMQELNMHGNQVHDSDGSLAEKLNVNSIPHFLLYGPDGKLITYKTTRPSQPATREILLSLPAAK